MASILALPSRANAAYGYNSSYTFYIPQGGDGAYLEKIKQALKDNAEGFSGFSQTAVMVRGGVFGNEPKAMTYNKDYTGCAQSGSQGPSLGGCGVNSGNHFGGQDANLYVYSITYGCEPGKGLVSTAGAANENAHYEIEFTVSLDLAGDRGSLIKNNKLNDTVNLHWAGLNKVTQWDAKQAQTIRAKNSVLLANRIPQECKPSLPADANRANVGEDAGKNVNFSIPVYQAASSSIKQNWGDLATIADAGGVGTANAGSSPGLTCDISFNPLTWLLCPAVKGMINIVGDLDDIITSQLSVGSPGNSENPSQIFCTSSSTGNARQSCESYKKAWAVVRNIALGLMVLAGLIILIAQALGMEILDAYTIRKTLPRVLIAAIGITLSWQLMQFFVTFTNALGFGVRYLIYQPFVGLDSATLQGGGSVATGIVGAAAITALGIFGLLSFAATAALAVFVAFLVLIVRQLLIIILIIFAPIAIVAYILPNTQNVYKIWWDSFAKALLMFPIIAAFIAAGRVFAVVSGVNGGGALGQLMGFAAYFMPYFLLPLTFRFAGGALRNIGGFVNDRSRGGFDRLRNYRAEQAKKNIELMRTNRRFNPNRKGAIGWTNRRLNTGLSAITSPSASAKIYGGSLLDKAGLKNSLGKGIINQIDQTKLQHSQKLGEKLNQLGLNDRALKTLMGMDDFSAGSIRTEAERLSRSSNNNDRLAAAQLSSSATFLSQSLYSDPEMGRADIRAAAGLAITAQGFGDTNDVADVANKLGGSSSGLASGFVTQAQLNGQRAGRLDMKPGYGIQIGEEGKYFGAGFKVDNHTGEILTSPAERDRLVGHQIKRLMTTGQQEFQGAKAPSVSAVSGGLKQMLQTKDFDANDMAEYEYTNEMGIKETVKFSRGDVERIAAMLGTAQSDYSGTSAATYSEIDKIVQESSMNEYTRRAYEQARRQEMDPRRTIPGAEGGEPKGDK